MMRLPSLNQSGDTLVEIMVATAVLSVVLAGAFTLSNRATRLNQTSNEHTEVSNLIQREAELIRAKHSQGSGVFWTAIDTSHQRSGAENTTYCETGPSPNGSAFFMDAEATDPVDSTNTDYIGFSDTETGGVITDAFPSDLYTVWIEAKNSAPVSHTDFFIYACWEGIGGEGYQRSGLVMRIAR